MGNRDIHVNWHNLITPFTTAYEFTYGPPAVAQDPIAITHFGSGIWSYKRRTIGAIFFVTVPDTIITSDCLGEVRKMTQIDLNHNVMNLLPSFQLHSMPVRMSLAIKNYFAPILSTVPM